MKLNFYIFLYIITQINITTFAQTAQDFTMTSTDGVTFNLYEQLDSNKIVILDFFSVGCPSCQQNTPYLDSIWQADGYNGDSVWVWGIESYNADSAQIEQFKETYGATFPCFSTKDDTTVLGLYNITYTPQYYIICPVNKTSKKIDVTSIPSYINSCKEELYTETKKINTNLSLRYLIFQNENSVTIINNDKKNISYCVSSISGSVILNGEVNKKTNKTFNLPKGLYFITIFSRQVNFIKTSKIVIL